MATATDDIILTAASSHESKSPVRRTARMLDDGANNRKDIAGPIPAPL